MCYFNIIQLSRTKIEEENRLDIDDIYEDPVYLDSCDWGGEKRDYNKVIGSIAEDLDDIATVDVEKRTITFKDKDTVRNFYITNLRKSVEAHIRSLETQNGMEKEHFWLKRQLQNPTGTRDIYYIDFCINQDSLILQYLNGDIPQTLHIGAILEGHF